MIRGPKRKTVEWNGILSLGTTSTGTTGGEAGLASFFFILLVHLILTPTFGLT
jgi:hypothetical protein